MPSAGEATQQAIDIANRYLKPLFKSSTISKEQFKEINKYVAHSVRDTYKGEALDSAFEARVAQLLEVKRNEVISRDGNGSGNGAAGVAAPEAEAEARKRARELSGETDEPPATRQQAEAQGGAGGAGAPPAPPPAPPPHLNDLQPLERGGPSAAPMVDLAHLHETSQAPIVTDFAPAVAPGTLGRRLEVRSNACPIIADGMGPDWDLVVTQYDVHFTWLEVNAQGEHEAKKIEPKVADQLYRPLQALFGGACTYDGSKIVYAARALAAGDLSERASAAHWRVEEEEGAPVFTLTLEGEQLGRLRARQQNASSDEEAARLQSQIDNLAARTVRVRQGAGAPLEMRRLCSEHAMAELRLEYRKYFAVLDLAFKLHPWLYKPVKSAYYLENIAENSRYCKQLGREPNQQLWLGYRQKIIDTARGPMLMIDTAAYATYAPCNVLDLLVAKLPSVRNKEQLTLRHVKDAERQLTTLIGNKAPKVKSRHATRDYKLAAIDDAPANQRTFYDEQAGRDRTVADYFQEKYPNHPLQYPHLPCVNVKKGGAKPVFIPIELLSLIGGEPLSMTPAIQAEMVAVTSKEPAVRFDEINTIISDRAPGGRDANACPAAAFGLRINQAPMTVEGRQLPSPRLRYKCHRTKKDVVIDVKPEDGSWRMVDRGQDVGFTEPAAQPRAWAVLSFAPKLHERELEDFVRIFMGVARDRGIELGGDRRQLPAMRTMEPPRDPRTAGKVMEGELKRMLGDRYAELDLVVCVLPEVKNLYEAVKRWSEATAGIPVQCAKAEKIMGNPERRQKPLGQDKQYHAGLLLKLNLKMGGGNVQMAPPDEQAQPLHGGRPRRGMGLALMQDRPTMVCGVDVYHPPPGSPQPSWVALVASLDMHCSKWHTIVDVQTSRQEQLGAAPTPAAGQAESFSLLKHMSTCLRKFVELNNCPPQRIIFYRDGVAHNQFDIVMTQEIAAISRVLEEQRLAGSCELIFVVAQKKTNARFAATREQGGTLPSGSKGKDGGKGGKGKGKGGGGGGGGGGFGGGDGKMLGNVPCGTVVDTLITDRNTFNFYLTSQHGLKGTCRPTHYHVLRCPPSLTADEIQQFTFDLCHIYARCTKIASRPAPLYYAHLAAAHCPWYEKDGFREVSDTWEHGSTSSGGSRGSQKSKSNYEPLHERQASRLYYC